MSLGLEFNAVDAISGVRAESGSIVTLVDDSLISITQVPNWWGGAALLATDTGSLVDGRNGTRIVAAGDGLVGAYMKDGGVVLVDASTGFLLTSSDSTYSSNGIVVDNTIAPSDALGADLVFEFDGVGGTAVAAINGGQVTVNGMTVCGAGATSGAFAKADSQINLVGMTRITMSGGGFTTATSIDPFWLFRHDLPCRACRTVGARRYDQWIECHYSIDHQQLSWRVGHSRWSRRSPYRPQRHPHFNCHHARGRRCGRWSLGVANVCLLDQHRGSLVSWRAVLGGHAATPRHARDHLGRGQFGRRTRQRRIDRCKKFFDHRKWCRRQRTLCIADRKLAGQHNEYFRRKPAVFAGQRHYGGGLAAELQCERRGSR